MATGHHVTQVLLWGIPPAPRDRPAAPLEPAELKALWEDLVAEEPARAYRAIVKLAGSPRGIALLGERLRPRATAEEERLSRLVSALDDPKFTVRQAAADELKAAGSAARAPLSAALGRNPSLEQQRRLEPVLKVLPRATRLVPAGEPLRSFRAVQVLERSGTRAARDVLVRLADGPPHAALSAWARAALQRLVRSPSALRPGGGV
jgi:hypothetical protein